MIKKIILSSTLTGVVLVALLANAKPVTEPTPQADTKPITQLSQVIETPTAEPIQEHTTIEKPTLLPTETTNEEKVVEVKVEPTPTEKPITVSSKSNHTKTATPKSGDTNNNGEIWIEGFGWVENNGGGNQVIVNHDMYENGNKVGIMGGDAPTTTSKPKAPIEEYVPKAGDIQTDMQSGIESIYVEGKGFVPMTNEQKGGN